MSVVLECPACGERTSAGDEPPARCGHCGEPYPDEMRERAMEAVLGKRPVFLTVLMWFLGFWAGAASITLFTLWLGDGPVRYNGSPTPRELVVRLITPLFLPLALASGASWLALWMRWPWARWALMLVVVLIGVLPGVAITGSPLVDPDPSIAWRGLIFMVLLGAPLTWYLYRKPNVRTYFDRLAEGRR